MPRKATLAHWQSAIAGRVSMKYAAANAPKGPSVVVGGVEGVAGEVEAESGMTPGRIIEREIMAGATVVELSAIFPIPHTSKFLIFFHSSVRDIVLPAVRVRLRLGHGAGHRQVIALLARVVLPVALVLAVQFVHVRSLRLRDVDHRRQGARRLHHHAVAVAARRHTHLVTMSGIVGPEGATAAAHQRVADGSVRQHVAVVPVGAQTAVVAGAVQAPVALEGIVLRRANGHHHVGEEARGTGASVEAEAGAQRTEGKGHRVGVEAGLGVRARASPVEKVGAKKET